jgi:hypothetical protein
VVSISVDLRGVGINGFMALLIVKVLLHTTGVCNGLGSTCEAIFLAEASSRRLHIIVESFIWGAAELAVVVAWISDRGGMDLRSSRDPPSRTPRRGRGAGITEKCPQGSSSFDDISPPPGGREISASGSPDERRSHSARLRVDS